MLYGCWMKSASYRQCWRKKRRRESYSQFLRGKLSRKMRWGLWNWMGEPQAVRTSNEREIKCRFAEAIRHLYTILFIFLTKVFLLHYLCDMIFYDKSIKNWIFFRAKFFVFFSSFFTFKYKSHKTFNPRGDWCKHRKFPKPLQPKVWQRYFLVSFGLFCCHCINVQPPSFWYK